MTMDKTDDPEFPSDRPHNSAPPANDDTRIPSETREVRRRRLCAMLARLKQEHRDLDVAIQSLEASVHADQLQLKRLKKKKLQLKDEIARTEDELFPDIIA